MGVDIPLAYVILLHVSKRATAAVGYRRRAGEDVPVAQFLRSGRASLDLAWTVRYRNVHPTDLLTGGRALESWLRETYPEVRFSPSLCTPEVLLQATTLREAIHAAVKATVTGAAVTSSDRAVINRAARGKRFVHQLDADGAQGPRATSGEQFLAELAIDGIQVLSADPSRLRFCEGPNCGLPFFDESRSGSRRWCTAQRCGNRVNTKAYRSRAKTRGHAVATARE